MKRPEKFKYQDITVEAVAITTIGTLAQALLKHGVDRLVIAKGFEEAAKLMYASAETNKPT